jgi:hypothetical protein
MPIYDLREKEPAVKTYILGLDLGQAQDYTALVVLECTTRDTGKTKTLYLPVSSRAGQSPYQVLPVPVMENLYAVRHLERLALGTSYPAQVARVKVLFDSLVNGEKKPCLVVDQTGVGRPIIDMLRAAELPATAVTITGGDTVSSDGNDYRVPKRDLVSTVKAVSQTDRLRVAPELSEGQTLANELLAFKVAISTRGHDSYGNDVGLWRENAHDDMVLATALACWYGENVPTYVEPERFGSRIRSGSTF